MRLRLERQAIYNILTHSPQKGKCIFCAPKFGTFILEIPHCGALTWKSQGALRLPCRLLRQAQGPHGVCVTRLIPPAGVSLPLGFPRATVQQVLHPAGGFHPRRRDDAGVSRKN